MIVPTVGRIVLYRTHDEDIRPHHRLDNQPLAAIVVGVHSDTRVNLMVFGADGSQHPRMQVYLAQGDEAQDAEAPFAEWMPYQKGQAAKTEQLETLIKDTGAPEAVAAAEARLAGGAKPQTEPTPTGAALEAHGAAPGANTETTLQPALEAGEAGKVAGLDLLEQRLAGGETDKLPSVEDPLG